jgi:predicted amidophosphoribosyltransferase
LRSQFNGCFAAYPYEGPARELVQALKFRGAVSAAREMAALIIERVPPGLLEGAVLVPAPAHPSRRRSRGFNQAALLAQEIAAACDLAVADMLIRDRGRAPQATLSRSERLLLPAGSIRVGGMRFDQVMAASQKRLANGKSLAEFPTKVVLLDDVVTTGCTLEICASAIRERYPSGSSKMTSAPMLEVGILTFASTSAHPNQAGG